MDLRNGVRSNDPVVGAVGDVRSVGAPAGFVLGKDARELLGGGGRFGSRVGVGVGVGVDALSAAAGPPHPANKMAPMAKKGSSLFNFPPKCSSDECRIRPTADNVLPLEENGNVLHSYVGVFLYRHDADCCGFGRYQEGVGSTEVIKPPPSRSNAARAGMDPRQS